MSRLPSANTVWMVQHVLPAIYPDRLEHVARAVRIMLEAASLGVLIMTKFEIMALIMRKESQFEGDAFTIAAKLATCLEPLSERLEDDELAELIQIGGAIYHFGVEQYKDSVPLEDLFPACENWPCPHPDRGGFRH
jgi:hypothetical protein